MAPTGRVQLGDCETDPTLMPQGHRRPVQGGKIYGTAGHDKGIALIEHPTTDTKPPTANLETRSKADSLGGLCRRSKLKTGSAKFTNEVQFLYDRELLWDNITHI